MAGMESNANNRSVNPIATSASISGVTARLPSMRVMNRSPS